MIINDQSGKQKAYSSINIITKKNTRVPEVGLELGSWRVAFLIPLPNKDCSPNIRHFQFW